jgi:hypothetical protein
MSARHSHIKDVRIRDRKEAKVQKRERKREQKAMWTCQNPSCNCQGIAHDLTFCPMCRKPKEEAQPPKPVVPVVWPEPKK